MGGAGGGGQIGKGDGFKIRCSQELVGSSPTRRTSPCVVRRMSDSFSSSRATCLAPVKGAPLAAVPRPTIRDCLAGRLPRAVARGATEGCPTCGHGRHNFG